MTTNIPDITICPFTGLQIDPKEINDVPNKILVFSYSNKIIGKVEMPNLVYVSIFDKFLGKDIVYMNNLYIYIGIIRNHSEKYGTPFCVSIDFIEKGYKDFDYPKEFRPKAFYFLNYLYQNGGKEYKSFSLNPNHYPLSYSQNYDEFQRIIEFLEGENIIEYIGELQKAESGLMINFTIRITTFGLKEIEKDFPIAPMWDLVKQEVFTGDVSIDDKIMHAKKLFFKTNSTFNDKRSACEALSFILEPIREELKKVLSNSDVSDFFNIVNTFDIRHNKESTKSIKHEEQLEWIFYSLLNSIICFYKLWNK